MTQTRKVSMIVALSLTVCIALILVAPLGLIPYAIGLALGTRL